MLEDLDCNGDFCSDGEEVRPQRCTRQSLNERFAKECSDKGKIQEKDDSGQLSQSFASWCDTFSSSLTTVNPRRALRNGAEKLSQTLNTVRTTFGTLSQKLRKSTRRRQPLKNIDSPKTPMTPYTRSRNVLGRTPTKLYSPFSIETPSGKENVRRRSSIKAVSPVKNTKKNLRKKVKDHGEGHALRDVSSASFSPGMKFSRDLVQTQIGIYEFQSTANRIIQKRGLN